MRVIMLTNTRYKGRSLRTNDTLEVPEAIGARWYSNGIASIEEEGHDVSIVCNEGTISELPEEGSGGPTTGQRENVTKSKRDGSAGKPRKNKS